METELCNMCMIIDQAGRVLVQDRRPKPTNAWHGLSFPGGHVEPGENVIESVIREVREETGFTVSNLVSAGYVHWYNPEKQSNYFFSFQDQLFLWRTGIIPRGIGFVDDASRNVGRASGLEYENISYRVPERSNSAGVWNFWEGTGTYR